MNRVLSLVLLAAISVPAFANETSWYFLQSGNAASTPLHDRGIYGQGQIIAILDTGLDYDNCYFAEADNSAPPVNTGSPDGTLRWINVDGSRRKVIAYDFLYSCDQFSGARGCDDPASPLAYDNQGHGTHAAGAAAADKGAPFLHDYADAIAPGAKLVIQDAGFIGGDSCAQRPGLGCPLRELGPVLQQAYLQGARIHSNSWGDLQGVPPPFVPPTANYSAGAAEIDAFVYAHPDMLVIFNTGNAGILGPSSASAPGVAKNSIDVGGAYMNNNGDLTVSDYSGRGPTRDGRIKPDLIGPDSVIAADSDLNVSSRNCDLSRQPGTSWASPTIAGAAALVRQYYVDGFYPSGRRKAVDGRIPSAALLKATLIASGRAAPLEDGAGGTHFSEAVPSFAQGFGMPVLDDALFFAGDVSQLRVLDRSQADGLTAGQAYTTRLRVSGGVPLRVVLVWTDPASQPRNATDSTSVLVNDLDLRLIAPDGTPHLGNDKSGTGNRDRLNNVEEVALANPAPGLYEVTVSAENLSGGARQGFALVVTGAVSDPLRTRPARR
ncbi:MAG: S8 family serine peptidase [Acidobacteriota bacterium]